MKLLISIIMIVVFVCGYMSVLAEDYCTLPEIRERSEVPLFGIERR